MEQFKLTLLIASNFFFILPGIRAFQLRRYTQGFVYFAVINFSSFYHLCKVDAFNSPHPEGQCILLSFETYNALDYFFAELTLVFTGLYLINFTGNHHQHKTSFSSSPLINKQSAQSKSLAWIELVYIYSYAVFIAISIATIMQGIKVFLAITGSLGCLVIVFWLYEYYIYTEVPQFDKKDIFIATATALLSIGLFIGDDEFAGPEWYWLFHSLWHIFGAVGQFYLLESRNSQYSGIAVFTQYLTFEEDPYKQAHKQFVPTDHFQEDQHHYYVDFERENIFSSELPLDSIWCLCDWTLLNVDY